MSVVLPVGDEGAGHRGGRLCLAPICGRYLGANVRVFCAGSLLVGEGRHRAGGEAHLRANPASVDERWHGDIETVYSPECVEGVFSEVELPLYGVLRSSPHTSNSKQHQIYAK